MLPSTRPRITASSAYTSPTMMAFSPITNPEARMSPSILPSTCTSPAEINVPLTISSALMTDGASLVLGRLGWGVGLADGATSGSLLFENIALCPYLPASIMGGRKPFLPHHRRRFLLSCSPAHNGHSPA